MKIPQLLLLKLSPLVDAARGEPLVEPFVELQEEAERRLRMRLSHGGFMVDGEASVLATRLSGVLECQVISLTR